MGMGASQQAGSARAPQSSSRTAVERSRQAASSHSSQQSLCAKQAGPTGCHQPRQGRPVTKAADTIMPAEYKAGKYHTYGEVQALLLGWSVEHPQLCTLESLGSSSEGRAIPILTITDSTTGSHDSKPAFWIDGNTHAGEVTGCEACLHFVDTLLRRCKAADPQVVQLLECSSIYVVPRISPDGAELYLTTPHTLRASTVLWPNATSPPGFLACDLDGSGDILTMKVPDRAGAFKQSELDPRLVVPRAPQDNDPRATYFNLLPEGRYEGGFDGFTKRASTRWGLDTNRTYRLRDISIATGIMI
jgi:murein tripeptide amidase MpaA